MWTAIRLSIIIAGLLLAASLPARADVLSPFTATYQGSYSFLSVGEATFELSRWGACWHWHGAANPAGLAALLMGNVTDNSYFCKVDNRLQPRQFSHREAADAEDSYDLKFTWPQGLASYNGGAGFQVPEGAIDPFLLQLAARRWLAQSDHPTSEQPQEFVVVDEDEVKHYRLAVSQGKRITVPAGTFDTVRIARVDKKDEELVFWAAPKLDFLPVLVEHREDGKTGLRLTLSSFHREQQKVIQKTKERTPPMS